MICLICGKSFPKHQDLDRHMNAPSIQHLYVNRSTHNYNFHCGICCNNFTKKEHLEQHLDLQLCKKSVPPRDTDEDPKVDDMESKVRKELTELRTIECMVCGKLFPRGAIDLQRHAVAITLKHLTSKKKNSMFPFGCSRCNLHFTSMEHAKSHEQFSTCNPNITWPENASSMSGLRAIPRIESEQPVSNEPNNSLKLQTESEHDQHVVEESNKRSADTELSDLQGNSMRQKRAKIIIPEGKNNHCRML